MLGAVTPQGFTVLGGRTRGHCSRPRPAWITAAEPSAHRDGHARATEFVAMKANHITRGKKSIQEITVAKLSFYLDRRN